MRLPRASRASIPCFVLRTKSLLRDPTHSNSQTILSHEGCSAGMLGVGRGAAPARMARNHAPGSPRVIPGSTMRASGFAGVARTSAGEIPRAQGARSRSGSATVGCGDLRRTPQWSAAGAGPFAQGSQLPRKKVGRNRKGATGWPRNPPTGAFGAPLPRAGAANGEETFNNSGSPLPRERSSLAV